MRKQCMHESSHFANSGGAHHARRSPAFGITSHCNQEPVILLESCSMLPNFAILRTICSCARACGRRAAGAAAGHEQRLADADARWKAELSCHALLCLRHHVDLGDADNAAYMQRDGILVMLRLPFSASRERWESTLYHI